jgi:hypothetical protein
MIVLHRLLQVARGVVDPGDELRVPFGVSRPKYDHFIEFVGCLEVANVFANLIQMGLLVGPGQDVIGSLFLISVDATNLK